MKYVFEDVDTGEQVDMDFDSECPPHIGETVSVHGATFRRIPSFTINAAQVARVTHQYPYVSRRLPRNPEGCNCTPDGKPIITSQRHEREIMGRYDLIRSEE